MLYAMVLEMTRLKPFLVFTVSPDVTLYLLCGKGKKSAWETRKVYGEVTAAFLTLSSATVTTSSNVMTVLERYVILLCDRTSGDIHVDQCCKHLFSSKERSLEAIPPTKGRARAAY